MHAGAAQLAQFNNIPICCSAGMTDSKLPDEQAGYEKMSTLLLAAMSRASHIQHAFGMLDDINMVSPKQVVLDDDIVLIVTHSSRHPTDEERSASEAIARLGPSGNYLKDEHTLRLMLSASVTPPMADRGNSATCAS